jgi:hypothetical protein
MEWLAQRQHALWVLSLHLPFFLILSYSFSYGRYNFLYIQPCTALLLGSLLYYSFAFVSFSIQILLLLYV